MPTRELHIAAFAVVALACVTPAEAQGPYGIGRSATPAEIAGWNIDIDRYGSYWPYAPTLFDYIRRAMPQNAPQSLSNDDVYAVSGYILNLNGLLPANATLDARTLSAIKMPNRNMFVSDPRPDVKNPACMTGC